jgi:TolA-binding protein
MKKVVIASVLAIATAGTLCVLPAGAQNSSGSSSGSITMKPAEYNAYNNAISQTSPAAQASAIEQFLKDYPNSPVQLSLLEKLVADYHAAGDNAKTLDASKRLLQADPNNVRALLLIAYEEKTQAGTSNIPELDEAASYAQKALQITKPSDLTVAQFDSVKPIFEDVIGNDALVKKDYKTAIQAFTQELKDFPNPADTTKGYAIVDTYNLANAYIQQNPRDILNAIWFFTRAAQFLPDPGKTTAEKAAEYWYQQYHGSMDGFPAVQQLAQANVFPPSTYTISPAPPPPSKADLAHQAVVNTPNLNSLSLHDKEYILANGNPDDAGKVWDILKGKVAEIPGVVISATADSVQLAVSPDAQNSHTADFTINMKKPLKKVPQPGDSVTYIATFSSYTPNPLMIILDDGIPKPPAAPRHHVVHHHARR